MTQSNKTIHNAGTKFVLKKESIFNEWDPSLLLYLRAFEKA